MLSPRGTVTIGRVPTPATPATPATPGVGGFINGIGNIFKNLPKTNAPTPSVNPPSNMPGTSGNQVGHHLNYQMKLVTRDANGVIVSAKVVLFDDINFADYNVLDYTADFIPSVIELKKTADGKYITPTAPPGQTDITSLIKSYGLYAVVALLIFWQLKK